MELAFNDDWKDTQQSEIEAAGLAPAEDRESAIQAVLTPGMYTAIVRGKDNTAGVGLMEVQPAVGATGCRPRHSVK